MKWQVQPERRGRSWRDPLTDQRRQAEKLLKESPILRSELMELRDEAYPDAVRDAVSDSGLRPQIFPSKCAFAIGQILDPDYLPEDGS